jgi:transposase
MGRPKLYPVKLDNQQRQHLNNQTRKGKAKARVMTRARILLLASEDRKDKEVARALQVSPATIKATRKRFNEQGLEAALSEKPRPGAVPKLDTKQEAVLIALACSDPPGKREDWTMQLLADRLVELEVVDSISDETVRRQLKKTISNRGRNAPGASAG